MARPKPDMSDATLARYEKLVATIPGLPRKGAANPYTSVGGNMQSFLGKNGRLALRMSKEDREAFMNKHRTKLAVAYNTVMKEYVDVPNSVFKKTALITKYFAASHAYVASLKPKATKKKAAKNKATKKKATKKKAAKKKATKKKATNKERKRA